MSANDRLIELVPEIQRRARHYAARYPQAGVSAEDCAGEAFLAFLKRSQEEPAFLDQPDEDIARRCVLDGWNTCHRRQRRQNRHELPLTEEHIMEDILPDGRPSPEEEAIRSDLVERVQEAIANLSLTTRGNKDTYLAIIAGLMEGLSPARIMEGLGVKRQNWSYYRRRLQHTFMALGEVA